MRAFGWIRLVSEGRTEAEKSMDKTIVFLVFTSEGRQINLLYRPSRESRAYDAAIPLAMFSNENFPTILVRWILCSLDTTLKVDKWLLFKQTLNASIIKSNNI